MSSLVRIACSTVLTLSAAIGVLLGRPGTANADGPPRDPVLLIGGIAADEGRLESFRIWLTGQGYTAFSMVLSGNPTGTAAIPESAQALAGKVAEIRGQTGAARVDLVGHSMGGLAQRYYVKFLGGFDTVGTYVDYGTPEQGDDLASVCALVSPGCRDLVPGSDFLTRLNADPAVPPGLAAYHFYSESAGAEKNSLPGAVNIGIQSFCPGRTVSHGEEPIDGALRQLIDTALRGVPLRTDCP
ncbi:alpha/beta hydrolase [Nocardia sp. ET3-3]|uniref:Alpha/beta hydrolase n=2 Tax=Nocardia terrae TaxID=2675851 RepID=A0A7K1V901_9NOCA|nr:alpha/beta hydrolase [Nocardia terrae]